MNKTMVDTPVDRDTNYFRMLRFSKYDSDSSTCESDGGSVTSITTPPSLSKPLEVQLSSPQRRKMNMDAQPSLSSFGGQEDDSSLSNTLSNTNNPRLNKHKLTSTPRSFQTEDNNVLTSKVHDAQDTTTASAGSEIQIQTPSYTNRRRSSSMTTPMKSISIESTPIPAKLDLPSIENDIYPSFTLTMSDKPMGRVRTQSLPKLQKLQEEVPCHGGVRVPTSPIRRSISLSLSIPPQSPLPVAKDILCKKSKQAREALKNQNTKLKSRIKIFRQKRRLKRELRKQQRALRRSRIIIIPSTHQLKILWDALTILVTIASAFQIHTYIRDRSTYEYDAFLIFTNIWFGIDLLLNFITDHRTSDGTVMRTGREVWGRYLTTWFAVDALSLLPWERMFIRPIIIMQNRRNIFTKWMFRSKAVVKVTRYIGKRKFIIKYFGKLSKETKKMGVGADKLIRLLIKYIPKYLLFYRNMKGVLLLKMLRNVHHLKKFSRGLTHLNKLHDEDYDHDNHDDDDEHDDDSLCSTDLEYLSKLDLDDEDNDHDDDCSGLINHDFRLTSSMDNGRNFSIYAGDMDNYVLNTRSQEVKGLSPRTRRRS